MSAKYFLQLATSVEGAWEEVDDFVFENWKHAILDISNPTPRYNGNRIKQEGSEISFAAETSLRTKDFAWIARFLGCGQTEFSSTVAGGIVRNPEYVQLRRRNQTILKKIHGSSFVARETK